MIKRYPAIKDTVITNAYKDNLTTRATGSNQGEVDTLQIFSIFGQASTSSVELSRALLQFSTDTITNDRQNGEIPASGSCAFYLRLYNAEHPFTVPRKFNTLIAPVSQSWEEGYGTDADGYVYDGVANWVEAVSGTFWASSGGDFLTGAYVPGSSLPSYSYYFERGTENLELDVTSLVEEWIDGTHANCGVGVMLSSGVETALSSSYVKKFFARGSEFTLKRPVVEARWDSSTKDNRGNFFASSSLADTENVNTLYLYNKVRGKKKNIPGIGTGSIYLKMFTEREAGTDLTPTPITGSWISTGVYGASFALNTTASTVFDRWYSSGLSTTYHTGAEITVMRLDSFSDANDSKYVISMPGLKSLYSLEEIPRFRVFTRKKEWNPNIYNIVNSEVPTDTIEDVYYKVSRAIDNFEVVSYGTGSNNETRLSYDVSGSYFDFPMDILLENYIHEFYIVYKTSEEQYEELPHKFKFRVEK